MKKNFALLIFLVFVFYSLDSSAASQKWVPQYQKKDVNSGKKINKKVTSSHKIGPAKKLTTIPIGTITKTKEANHKDLTSEQKELHSFFKMNLKGSSGAKVKAKTLKMAQEAIPVLLKVMRDGSFPDNSRWLATFLTGRIMGKKAANLMAKYTTHSNWVLRLSSLKVLQALDQKQFKGIYAKALKDDALIVRVQALDIINQFKLVDLAPFVWSMLYDSRNYKGNKGNRERTHIIKEAIKTIGNLNFKKAKEPMMTMIQDKKYVDIYPELDFALNKVSEIKSPEGSINKKRYFWSRQKLKETTI